MLKGFKQFILRGNVIDMAVGVVIGAAFATVVGAFTKDLLTPFLAVLVGQPDFSYVGFKIGATAFPVGDFINALISFLLVAAAVYFFVVTPVNALVARMRKAPRPPIPPPRNAPSASAKFLYRPSAVPIAGSRWPENWQRYMSLFAA